ncbi:MAG: hypothetical protein B7733_14935 [Myxococcales bacterium FL481]|nr:MAG: hypothetical protein B7733_14935 [Myxococcales bacterium FL481]
MIKLAEIRASSALRELLGAPSLRPAATRLHTGLDACHTRLAAFERIVVGLHTPTRNWMAVLSGDGLAEKSMATCLHRAVAQLVVGPGETSREAVRSWPIDRDHLALVSVGWAEAVERRLRGEGAAALETNLADARTQANPRLPIWYVADARSARDSLSSHLPSPLPRTIAGTMHFDENVHVSLYATFADHASAELAYRRFMSARSDGAGIEPVAALLARDVNVRADEDMVGIAGHVRPGELVTALGDTGPSESSSN